MTGMGSDGTRGIQQLTKNKKVHTIVQSQETCTVYGMPKVIVQNNMADQVVSLGKIAESIVKQMEVH